VKRATVSVYLPGGFCADILPRKTRVCSGPVKMVFPTKYSMSDRLNAWMWVKGGRGAR
jgi:hypothetical protein